MYIYSRLSQKFRNILLNTYACVCVCVCVWKVTDKDLVFNFLFFFFFFLNEMSQLWLKA